MHVLGDLLVAAVQVADLRIGLGDGFAVEFEHQAQHAVGRRVGRPHVEDHLLSRVVVAMGWWKIRFVEVGGGASATARKCHTSSASRKMNLRLFILRPLTAGSANANFPGA
jgi:hypothetical protein